MRRKDSVDSIVGKGRKQVGVREPLRGISNDYVKMVSMKCVQNSGL